MLGVEKEKVPPGPTQIQRICVEYDWNQTYSTEGSDNGEDGEEVGRYEKQKKAGLQEKSRRPHTCPRATKPWVRFKLKQEGQKLQQAGKRKAPLRYR